MRLVSPASAELFREAVWRVGVRRKEEEEEKKRKTAIEMESWNQNMKKAAEQSWWSEAACGCLCACVGGFQKERASRHPVIKEMEEVGWRVRGGGGYTHWVRGSETDRERGRERENKNKNRWSRRIMERYIRNERQWREGRRETEWRHASRVLEMDVGAVVSHLFSSTEL